MTKLQWPNYRPYPRCEISLGRSSPELSSPRKVISPPPLKMSVYFFIPSTIRKQWTNYISYSPFPRGFGVGSLVIPKGVSFNCVESNGCLKILIRNHCGKRGVRSGLYNLQCCRSIKKGTRAVDSHSSYPSLWAKESGQKGQLPPLLLPRTLNLHYILTKNFVCWNFSVECSLLDGWKSWK